MQAAKWEAGDDRCRVGEGGVEGGWRWGAIWEGGGWAMLVGARLGEGEGGWAATGEGWGRGMVRGRGRRATTTRELRGMVAQATEEEVVLRAMGAELGGGDGGEAWRWRWGWGDCAGVGAGDIFILLN
ncbi:UNVERIFIED_CONTAM: hypothetical protein Slati_0843900 [Sesamum latifolium]|uniref:Uncharacterized protein n=1 Tax=Sesamum latifolium TaxID=2727402 RepID=A0AAW2XLX5_9LAMI